MKTSDDMVIGMILVNLVPARTLFDCGASHSFISKRFAKELDLKHDLLDKS